MLNSVGYNNILGISTAKVFITSRNDKTAIYSHNVDFSCHLKHVFCGENFHQSFEDP